MTPFKYNYEFEVEILEIKCRYYYKADHRDNSKEKSQWVIKPLEELGVFKYSHIRGWKTDYKTWGLKINDKTKKYLGVNHSKEDLAVAVFVDSFKKNVWHGYPADFRRDKTDIPNSEILTEWKEKGYTTKAKVGQAIQGKICTL